MKFSQGDRVAVYVTFVGEPIRSRGTVIQVYKNRTVKVQLDTKDRHTGTESIITHEQQCRKLKDSPLKEWWLSTSVCGRETYSKPYDPMKSPPEGGKGWRIYHVREVR